MIRKLAFLIPLLVCVSSYADEKTAPKKGIEGFWYGVLKVGALELRMGFIIEKKDGKLVAVLDSVDQGQRRIPVEKVEFSDGKVTLSLPNLKATYKGELQADGNSIVGELDQRAKMQLDLTRADKALSNVRPQDPKKPYPYEEIDVTFESKAKDVKLGGTLTKPKGDGPYPVAVLISGSGPQDRNSTLLGHKPFHVIADYLTRRGIAVLRYDDRGVGKSTGSFSKATTKDFADDAAGAVAFLKARKDTGKVGLIGHSEGGLIAPIVATENSDVGFVVMLAGPGLPGDQILVAQSLLIVKAMGADEKAMNLQKTVQTKLVKLAKEGADLEKLKDVVKEIEKDLTEAEKKELKSQSKALEAGLANLITPWFRYFLNYDPRPVLENVKCPLLAINGDLDLQVPCDDNLIAIAKAVKSKGNKDVTTLAIPGLNHLFQTTKTGLPNEYGKIEETFSPRALKLVGDWIEKRK